MKLNFIFDFGDVLVNFKPRKYLSTLFSDNSIIDKMYDTVFKSKEWLIMDQGLLTHKEALEIFCQREPEYKEEIRKTIDNATDIVSPINETIDLLPIIRSAGHKLYYLSNMQKEIRAYLLENHKYIELFDGGIFSCEVHYIKPSPEIYRILINKYDLVPGESIFFDDMAENVSAAEKEGIKGILFTTAECVLEYLK